MIENIKREAEHRGITRLCHFTPSRNLVHIMGGEFGILATQRLTEHERNVFTPNDLLRLDQHRDYICCSIEYPNAWYFNRARHANRLFQDWVVLLIAPYHLWTPGTKFAPRNAAAAYGRYISEGEAAFLALFAAEVEGSRGGIFSRTANQLTCCPTDEQAEVLVKDRIPVDDLLGIAVPTEAQARNEAARFSYLGVAMKPPPLLIIPEIFDPQALHRAIRSGRRPAETSWAVR